MFPVLPRELYSWISPVGNYRNQIDCILSFCPATAYGSDRQLLIAEAQLKLKVARITITQGRLEVMNRLKFMSIFE